MLRLDQFTGIQANLWRVVKANKEQESRSDENLVPIVRAGGEAGGSKPCDMGRWMFLENHGCANHSASIFPGDMAEALNFREL
jgi:hypothetical protein